MYSEYYQLSTEPFKLTPEPSFVYAHQGYLKAQAEMRGALEQGIGFLVVTGCPGIGKSTLVKCFVEELSSENVLIATLNCEKFGESELLGRVSCAFGLDIGDADKASLLSKLEKLLLGQTGAFLVIDEAQNLSEGAFEDLRLLTYLRVDSRPLLQIFLLGNKELYERVHASEITQLHRGIIPVCELGPLSLQETHDYIVHRLHCAGWHGKPAITTKSFIMIHRYTQGLPRSIGMLCTRLLLHGAMEKRDRLDREDIVAVIHSLQSESQLPIQPSSGLIADESSSDLLDVILTGDLSGNSGLTLTTEEREFISNQATMKIVEATSLESAPVHSSVVKPALKSEVALPEGSPHQSFVWLKRMSKEAKKRYLLSSVLVTAIVVAGAYQLGIYNAGQRDKFDRSAPSVPQADTQKRAKGSHLPSQLNQKYAVKTQPLVVLPELNTAEALPVAPRPTGQYSAIAEPRVSTDSSAGERAIKIPVLPETVIEAPVPPGPAIETAVLSETAIDTPVFPQIVIETPVLPEAATGSPSVQNGPVEQGSKDKQVEKLLRLAEAAIEKYYLTFSSDESALYYYKQVLEIDPGNVAVERGLRLIAERYSELARFAAEKENYDRAQILINRGLGVVAGDSTLLSLQQELTKKQSE